MAKLRQKLQISHFDIICALRYFFPLLLVTASEACVQAFERDGKGSFRRERNARGHARREERKPVPLGLPRAWSCALIPFTFPFERLPRRLQSQKSLRKFAPLSYLPGSKVATLEF